MHRSTRQQLRTLLLGVTSLLPLVGCQSMSNPFATVPSATPADIAKFGPPATERIEKLKELQTAGPGTDTAVQDQRSSELARQIQTERDPLIRAQIVRTIEVYPTRVSSAVLYAALSDPASSVRIACAEAWGKRGSPEALQHLDKLYKTDEQIDVRLAAIKALGKTKQAAAIELIGPALEDKDPAMQFLAMESLRTLSGQDLGSDVSKWREFVKTPAGQRPQPSLAQQLRSFF